jgi:glutamate dehydrogenase (NAD(P)+)
MMHPDLPFADALGPVRVIHVHQPQLGLAGTVVIDNLACGPAIGGLRMEPDVTAAECARLARAMTFKNAAAGLPHGGGKSVLRADPGLPAEHKQRLIRAFAAALRDERGYIFGPDMGTDETCMAWVRDEIGRAVGLPRALGGIPLEVDGWGLDAVYSGTQKCLSCPPGLAPVTFSPRVRRSTRREKSTGCISAMLLPQRKKSWPTSRSTRSA